MYNIKRYTEWYTYYFVLKQSTESECKVKLIQTDGTVHPNLVKLIKLQGLEINDGSPIAVNKLLQNQWVKAKEGVFRSDLGGRFPTSEEMELLAPLGASEIPIHYDDPRTADPFSYMGTVILGATLRAVMRRIWFVASQKFKYSGLGETGFYAPFFFLGSKRPLDMEQEDQESAENILKEIGAVFTEEYYGRYYPEQTDHQIPWPTDEMEMMIEIACFMGIPGEKCFRVCAPDGKNKNGSTRPENTAETVKKFVKQSKPGYYLLVSSQPFCENQRMAVERAVEESGKTGYKFDVCGPSAPPLQLSRWLDNLAKQIWEEVQLLQK